MEFQSLSISTKKKKTDRGSKPPTSDVKRLRNWTTEETCHLLDAVDQVQTDRGQVGFKFQKVEREAIVKLFNDNVKNHPFSESNIFNRIKVLLHRFRICHELATLTGGGWDSNLDRPIAPSDTDYITMVQGKGKHATFLLSGSFPWYTMMLPMVGGQPARGDGRALAFNMEDPSVQVPLLELPIQVSEQGSSDEPVEFSNDYDDSDAVEEPRSGGGRSGGGRTYTRGRSGEHSSRGGGQSSRGGRQGSDSTFPSQGSGSKRKSTDESAGETSSKGRSYRDNARKKAADAKRLADAAATIADCMRVDVDRQDKKEGEIMACLKKMQELGIYGAAQAFLINNIENCGAFRAMFLNWTSVDVADYFARSNFFFGNQDHSTSNHDGTHIPMPPNNYPRPAYPNPNQGANNLSYHPRNSNF